MDGEERVERKREIRESKGEEDAKEDEGVKSRRNKYAGDKREKERKKAREEWEINRREREEREESSGDVTRRGERARHPPRYHKLRMKQVNRISLSAHLVSQHPAPQHHYLCRLSLFR